MTASQDAMLVAVCINSNSSSTFARDTLVDIGVDPAGGTSYTVLLPDLLGSCAGALEHIGVWYVFPVFVKSGSTIAARAAVNNATVGTLLVNVILFGKPTRPDLVKCGAKVTAYGITAASSRGTTVTPGTDVEGSWTQIVASTSEFHWWWQMGIGVNDASMSAIPYGCDCAYGDATNKHTIIENSILALTTSEQARYPALMDLIQGYREVPASSILYGRIECSTTPDSAISMALYGVS